MSSSVAAEIVRVDEWDRGAAGDADDVAKAEPPSQQEHGTAHALNTSVRTPPWPQRRLNDALADLGPARPPAADRSQHSPSADRAEPREAEPAPVVAAPEFVAVPANDVPAPEARTDLPPPPRPSRQPVTDPLSGEVADPAIFDWGDAALPDVDAAGADIVRALAFADSTPGEFAASRSLVSLDPGDDEDDQERPPMIIERALAEQGLALMGVAPAAQRLNPLPALTFGFSLSLLVGATLYIVMMAG